MNEYPENIYGKTHRITVDVKKPTLENRVYCALNVMVFGVDGCGISTFATLMEPLTIFNELQVKQESVSIMGSVCTALLTKLHRQDFAQILKDQDKRISLEYEL